VRFEFTTAFRIVFGAGTARNIGEIAREFGKRALVATGRTTHRLEAVLAGSNLDYVPLCVAGEPTVNIVREGVTLARKETCDVVIGFGGGSAIDGGKAIAALAPNSGEPLDYLEVIGQGRPLERPPLPFVAVPTTAGTGSEVTRNAVLGSPQHRVKASLRSPLMLPRVALVDPELTIGLPPEITASTGLDALTQLIEPYVSSRANAMTDLYCIEGMRRIVRSLCRAFEQGSDGEAREDMAFASLLGGLSLANAGLGVVHGFAAPIGGMFDVAHGAVCAALLPHGIRMNCRALRSRSPDHQSLERYRQTAALLTGNPDAAAEEAADWTAYLCRRLAIPPLSAYGITCDDIPQLVQKAATASSMKANPIPLTREELSAIVGQAL
jgi:alcohol dehydrogenase class IV